MTQCSEQTRSAAASLEHAHYLPLGVDVAGLRCLVAGGGRVGTRKAVTLARAGAEVTVVAPEITPRLKRWGVEGVITWQAATYDAEQLFGAWLVVAATADPALNVQIGIDARRRGVLSCLVSPGRMSQVIFPAVHTRDNVTIAVHTNGRDCAESRRVRDELARVLERRPAPPVRLTVFGLRREDVSAEMFGALADLADGGVPDVPDAVVLATCRRWECYFTAASARPVIQDILASVERRCGVLLDEHRPALYTRTGVAAHYHLLRVLSGLDSPILGETEIIGQVRRAREGGHRGASAEVRRALDSGLHAQKAIRGQSGLVPVGGSWANAAVKILERRIGRLSSRRVLLVGCGRLGEAVARQLLRAGAAVQPFSRRAPTGIAWCDSLGLSPRHPDELAGHLENASAVVVARRLDSGIRAWLARQGGSTSVLDLTEPGHAGSAGVNIVLAARIRGIDAARAAHAGKLAFVGALQFREHCASTVQSVRIGARRSALSRTQVEEVLGFLKIVSPQTHCDAAFLDSPGDRDKTTPLPLVRDEDFFTRDLDEALLRREIDLAVHSAKDLPARMPTGLAVAAVTPSFAPWECLVTRSGETLSDLPSGARIGTSSERRREGVLALRPDVTPCDVRGDVPDRIRQLDDGRYDALVLAAVSLIRLGVESRIAQVFLPEELPAAPGQGALALVIRNGDDDLRRLLEPLDIGDREGLPWA